MLILLRFLLVLYEGWPFRRVHGLHRVFHFGWSSVRARRGLVPDDLRRVLLGVLVHHGSIFSVSILPKL